MTAIRITEEIRQAVDELADDTGLTHQALIDWLEDPDFSILDQNDRVLMQDLNFWYGYLRGTADVYRLTAARLAEEVIFGDGPLDAPRRRPRGVIRALSGRR
jgi:hypothetical protein